MTLELQTKIDSLLKSWHESGRLAFETHFENLDYDSVYYAKTAKERRKYIALDAGSSGAFLVDKQTGDIFTIKAYGVPKHRVANIFDSQVTGLSLRKWRPS